ncbi:MAG: tetratricopeptide repeat protein [Xanthobacteraceae bacterium]
MNLIRRFCLVIATIIALAAGSLTGVSAQSSTADELNKKIIELFNSGKIAEAIPPAQQVLAIREKALGPDHPDVAQALHNLAVLYGQQGRYAEAAPLLKRALAIREKALGPDHLDVATTLNDLAHLYVEQGRHAEAEPLCKRSLAIVEKALGPDHPNFATSLNNLALLYDKQGRYAETEPLYKRALAIYEKALGPDHPFVATDLNNLASLYENQGRYAEAEPLYKRALAIQEKALGPNHPHVATDLNNLAHLYVEQGRYADAEPLCKRALSIREKALGPDHPDVATALNNLAWLYVEQGRYAEAEPLFKRALTIDEKALGPDHPDVALALNNLAKLYDDQGRYAEAEPLYKRALAIDEKALGPEHPDVAAALNNLAALYHNQGRYAEAEPLYKRALAIQEKALGPDHPHVAADLNNLALLYKDQGRYAEAEPLYKRALAIVEKALGADHPHVAMALNNLASLYDNQGRYPEAKPLYKRALAIREKALGPDHPDVAAALHNLTAFYAEQSRYADALPLARRLIAGKFAKSWPVLPVLAGAQAAKLIAPDEAIDDGLNVEQRDTQTAASDALNALAVRFSAGNDRLAQLVRQDQDLAGEAATLDKALIAAVSQEPAKRDAAVEQKTKDRIGVVAKQRDDLQAVFAKEFPDYAALSNPQPMTVKDVQGLLANDEALVIIELGGHSYVWAITRNAVDWKDLGINAGQVAKSVTTLRAGLDPTNFRPFDPALSYGLYRQLLGPVEPIIAGKPRFSLVVNGALTSLPLQVLVVSDPVGKALKDVDWLIRSHAVTVLPSVESLRGKSAVAAAPSPLIGFANPILKLDSPQLQQDTRLAANVAVSRGTRGPIADLAALRAGLPELPETADELKQVAKSVKADPADLFIGPDATETRVKQSKLDNFRIVYFATHGLLAGDVAEYAKLNAEPALVLTLPEKPTEYDNGLLTASEVAQLKLNANWVVLSACNTAAGDKPGAEALSGLARAFFYAGARSLIVSNWEVESNATVALMTGTFAALTADPTLSHAEALRKSILAMIDSANRPLFSDLADPKYWAPFIVVGEPAKPTK